LGAQLSFERTAEEIERLRRIPLSASTARRLTEEAGAACVERIEAEVERIEAEVERIEAEVERLEREASEPPIGPERMVLSADGAMVPLLKGEWAEVKTMALGVVLGRDGEGEAITGEWSYFSRLTDAETFARAASWETERRGLAQAGSVAAVTDGAEWLQGFIDYHRPDATRILDFSHAAQHLSDLCAALGEGDREFVARRHLLKKEGSKDLIEEGRKARDEREDLREALSEALPYLEKREAMMAYPDFLAAGWPIGSGSVESANKVVVEARLKGAGMHWKRENVDPMLALRNALCSDRWEEAWKEIAAALRARQARERREKREERRAAASQAVAIPPIEDAPTTVLLKPEASSPSLPARKPSRNPSAHPWRRFRTANAGYFSSHAKL
jgi:hypothetical protein